jgi:di/tricarboxylate transporter
VAWTVLDLDEAPVALLAALALLATGSITPRAFYASLGHDLIWLLLGAFLLAAVMRHSGLAERVALRAVAHSRTPRGLMLRLTGLISLTAFVVPSTSGRAALLLPVFLALAPALPRPRHVTALALLFPSVILLSAAASLLGAGAHLVALDLLGRMGRPVPGFFGWMLLAAPFALVSSLLACELILRLTLSRADRAQLLELPPPVAQAMDRRQQAVAVLVTLTVLAWCTEAWHGVPAPVVAMGAALLATLKPLTGSDFKGAMGQVEWNLILFMAATLVLGEALIGSGAAAAVATRVTASLDTASWPAAALWAAVALVALLAHLLIASRTARATVLLATVALPLSASGVALELLVFTLVIGSGFCQTLTASAKPVALLAQAGGAHAYGPRELLRLSAALLLPLWGLLWLWAFVVWPLQGLG